MIKKSFYIVVDFYRSIKLGELIESVLLPICIVILTFFFLGKNFDNIFLSSFNDSILTITSFLIAFSICSVTLLFSTSNSNITAAKETMTRRVNFSNDKISYFQLIQIRSYYNVVIEFLLIMLSIAYKVLSTGFNVIGLFYF
ncbi:hypothetical protein [Terrisporobacter hibernicus]|uniref:ABC transporter permease n=1 Tax=Terrisporobacter hibernicus TaxID=2813371 RepID=A0AAX2ZFK3_9FIRM|nr:hypothetical protein [Terrisporobacter hibernicus]UEL48113.1 hypothetical protein JW646_01295 [Terrisporobacter hibernicus]